MNHTLHDTVIMIPSTRTLQLLNNILDYTICFPLMSEYEKKLLYFTGIVDLIAETEAIPKAEAVLKLM